VKKNIVDGDFRLVTIHYIVGDEERHDEHYNVDEIVMTAKTATLIHENGSSDMYVFDNILKMKTKFANE
jgi:hypothetical protein